MTRAELEARSHARAKNQGVRILAVKGRPGVYRTTSKSKPGVWYSLVSQGGSVACSCPGWHYRADCKHSQQLRDRIARERQAALSGKEDPFEDLIDAA